MQGAARTDQSSCQRLESTGGRFSAHGAAFSFASTRLPMPRQNAVTTMISNTE
ncbi:hypothetical protein DP44_4920 [Burkholderia pseudomallei]|nr:hypothetical protein DP44_4920 [Burkholderia pseudomallei]